jgi:hypothetical protein
LFHVRTSFHNKLFFERNFQLRILGPVETMIAHFDGAAYKPAASSGSFMTIVGHPRAFFQPPQFPQDN